MSKIPPVAEMEKIQKYKSKLVKGVKKKLQATKQFILNQSKSDKNQDTA